MKIAVDVNVVLDVLLNRAPFAVDASEILTLAEERVITAYLCATGITTIHHVARKTIGTAAAKRRLLTLLSFMHIAAVDAKVVERALYSKLADFGDAVLAEAAAAQGVDAIVTRDAFGFREALLRAYSPRELIAALGRSAKS